MATEPMLESFDWAAAPGGDFPPIIGGTTEESPASTSAAPTRGSSGDVLSLFVSGSTA